MYPRISNIYLFIKLQAYTKARVNRLLLIIPVKCSLIFSSVIWFAGKNACSGLNFDLFILFYSKSLLVSVLILYTRCSKEILMLNLLAGGSSFIEHREQAYV